MPSPRLAAIMFTDIVDYTAMMQQNQHQAMEVIRLYESYLREKIALLQSRQNSFQKIRNINDHQPLSFGIGIPFWNNDIALIHL